MSSTVYPTSGAVPAQEQDPSQVIVATQAPRIAIESVTPPLTRDVSLLKRLLMNRSL